MIGGLNIVGVMCSEFFESPIIYSDLDITDMYRLSDLINAISKIVSMINRSCITARNLARWIEDEIYMIETEYISGFNGHPNIGLALEGSRQAYSGETDLGFNDNNIIDTESRYYIHREPLIVREEPPIVFVESDDDDGYSDE